MIAWVNIYPEGLHGHIGNAYRSREQAEMFAHPNRMACVRIEVGIGDGLWRSQTAADAEWEAAGRKK